MHFDIGGYDITWWNTENIDDFKISLIKKIKQRLAVIEK